MNDIVILENLKIDRLMSLVRRFRLYIPSDYKILVIEGDQV